MKSILGLMLCMLALPALAVDMQTCLEYKFPDAPPDSWVLQDDSDGKGPYIKEWRLPAPKPTLAELAAVEALAVAWKADKEKTSKANYETWSEPELKALVQVLLDEINGLRKAAKLPERTPEQLKTAIKEKL